MAAPLGVAGAMQKFAVTPPTKAMFAGIGALALASVARAAGPEWDLNDLTPTSPNIYRLRDADSKDLKEASGLILSRTRPDVFWTHNDGARAELYALDHDGNLLQTVEVAGFDPEDFEDIAADGGGNLYLSDTGDNRERRSEVKVVRVREPRAGERTAAVSTTWHLKWPDGARDAESLFIHGGYGWLVGRVRSNGQTCPLMRFPLSETSTTVTLEHMGDLAADSPAAGADLTADGRKMAVISRAAVFLWNVDGDPARATTAPPVRIDFNFGFQNEGIAFVPQGVLVLAEGNARHLLTVPYLVNVPGPLKFTALRPISNGLELVWDGVQGRLYTFQRRSYLADGGWETAATNVIGQGAGSIYSLPVDSGNDHPIFLQIRE